MKIEDAKRGLRLLRESGMQKLNFSGGEPFLHKKFLGDLAKFCKEELALESVSIVSNGSCIDSAWMKKYGRYVDILAVSCDSLDPDILRKMGRCDKKGQTDHIDQMMRVRGWCEQFDVVFKINSVVTSINAHEDLTEHIKALQPRRWKVFQVLPVDGENRGTNPTSRNVDDLLISQKTFEAYVARHRRDPDVARVLVPEDNEHMRDSYLILDQHMRFLNCTTGAKIPTESILEGGGVEQALAQAGHDEAMFFDRGGLYPWKKAEILGESMVDVEEMPAGFVLAAA